MTAKEWLIEETDFLEKVASLNYDTSKGFSYPLDLIMERYANYKTQELQGKILSFREVLKQIVTDNSSNSEYLEKYYSHFNIKVATNGKIG